MESINSTVDSWIADEQLPSKHRRVSRFDCRYGYQRVDLHGTEAVFRDREHEMDEAEAYWDFMDWAMSREHVLLLGVPRPERDSDFWVVEIDEEGNDVSAFNTIDYNRLQEPLNSYHYRLKKIYERVLDLAQTHASISHEQGRENTFMKFKSLVEVEFRDKALVLRDTYKRYKLWCYKERFLREIRRLNIQIQKCKQIWRDNAYLP